MRFVNLLPGGSVPARITVGDGAKQRTLVDSVRAGAVTGWVHVPTNESGYIAVGHEAIATLSYPEQAGDRETVVFGRNDGNYTTTEFEERGARVVGQSGDIGSHQLQAPAGHDLVIGLGHGLGVPSPDGVAYDVRLGVAGRGCASGPTSDGGGTVGQDFPYGVALGEVELVWTVRDGCRVPDSGAARVTLRPGETVYAMTWFSDRVHLRLLALPVTASRPGARGLVDSGDGPVFDFGTETYTDGGGS